MKYLNIFLVLFAFTLHSQNSRALAWKKIRKEVVVQIGAAQFLGDLGGLNRTGTDLSPADVEFSLTKVALSIGYRYKFAKSINSYTSFNYLQVSGDDKLTKEPFRNNRNLNFRSNIFELSTRIELCIFSNKIGNRYSIKKTFSSRYKNRSWELIGFIGLGGFYYNPKGRLSNASAYVALKPLHTEGQGLANAPSQYSNLAVSIPIGAAFRTIIKKKWSIGIEINYRKTFTDYIDDVSTVYYNKTLLATNYGSISAQMADPSTGNIPGATSPDASGNSAQRGDKDKDSFMSFQVNVGYFLSSGKKTLRLRSKF